MVAILLATAHLFLDAGKQALKNLFKHPFKPLFGFLFIFVTGLVERNSGLFPGFAGGMILGLALTFILAGFLALVNLLIDAKRFNLQETITLTTGIFSPLISSLFILFIAKFFLQPLLMQGDAQLWLSMIYAALFVFFNPLPEVIARKGVGGMDAFREALEFMKENGPEWLASVLLMFLPLIIISGPAFVLKMISSDDPLNVLFNLIRYSVLIFAMLTSGLSFPGQVFVEILLMALGLYYVFFMFLFRITLFEALNRTTRRKRVYAFSTK